MKKAPSARSGYRAPALERGLDILEYLAGEAPRTQIEIARALGKGSSEVFRMLAILEARGYLTKSTESGAYSLTLRLFAMSHMHSPFADLVRHAEQPMRELAHAIRESCHLSILSGSQLLVLAQQPGPSPVQVSIEPGALFPAFRTASGRLLLAGLARDTLSAILDSDPVYAGLKEKERKSVLARVAVARKRGYAEAAEETYQGVYDLAVPVGGPGCPVRAALTASCLTSRSQKTHPRLLGPLRHCAARIVQKAGL